MIGLTIILIYNLKLEHGPKNLISVEEIFILFMLPGFDMLRLFIIRLANRRNPFSSDLDHLHHLLLHKFKLINSLLIYFFSIIAPLLLYNFTSIKSLYIIVIFLVYYLLLFLFLKKFR